MVALLWHPKTNSNNHETLGFTLVEMILVISITALLAAIAIPSVKTMISNSQTKDLMSQLLTALRLAKNTAIARGVNVQICALNATATACDNAATVWQYGWQVYIPSSNTVIQTFKPAAGANNVSVSASTTNTGPTFAPNGFTFPGGATYAFIYSNTFDSGTYCWSRKGIGVSLSGQIQLTSTMSC